MSPWNVSVSASIAIWRVSSLAKSVVLVGLENQKRVCLGADIEDGTVFVLKRAGLKKQQSSVLPEQLPKVSRNLPLLY